MSVQNENVMKVVLYEGSGSTPMDGEERFHYVSTILDQGYEVCVLGPGNEIECEEHSNFLVLGKFTNGHPNIYREETNQSTFYFENLVNKPVEELSAVLNKIREEVSMVQPGTWKPWFPAIDYDRCTNCLQCLSFCLFDVYGLDDDKKIQVQNPTKCKTDCPACSRVCPDVAILFPKYKGGPINGDVVSEADLQREKMKVDISSLLGGDIYSALRDRREKAKSRFSKERDESRALKERMRCLAKLKQEMDIPDEVLNSLPSMGDIEAKAQQLAQKHQ